MTAIELQTQHRDFIKNLLELDTESLERVKKYVARLRTSSCKKITLKETGLSEELFKVLSKKSEEDFANNRYINSEELINKINRERGWK